MKWTQASNETLAQHLADGNDVPFIARSMRFSRTHIRRKSKSKDVMSLISKITGSVRPEYYEGIASHPAQDCPYAYASDIGAYCAWWAGWADTDRGLA